MGTPVADGRVFFFFGGKDSPIGISILGDEQRLTEDQAREVLHELARRLGASIFRDRQILPHEECGEPTSGGHFCGEPDGHDGPHRDRRPR